MRVTNLELFFDLVFVFTITQLTTLLVRDLSPAAVLQMVLVFGNVWWMYGGYAWLTNAVPPRDPVIRLLLLVGMGGFLLVALAIPTVFAGGGVAFGVGYLVVNLVHTGLFLRAAEESVLGAMARLGPFNIITALLLLAAGFTAPSTRVVLFAVGFVLHWITPYLTRPEGFTIRAAHFVERHGLILLIALGESVVAVGIGLGAVALPPGRIVAAVCGLALAAALWWLYFDGEDARAERALRTAPRGRAQWLALYAFGYDFLPILSGIVVLAAGVKLAVVRVAEPTLVATAVFLSAGVALYCLGLAIFRWVIRSGSPAIRLAMAVLALPVAGLGLAVSPTAQLAALTAVIFAGALAERALASPRRR